MFRKSVTAFVLCSALVLGLASPHLAGAHTSVAASSPYLVTREGATYRAASQSTTLNYTGTLKFVVESAAKQLRTGGGGTITFAAGDFDLGPDRFILSKLTDVVIQGQGIDVTTIRNLTDASADTEPFDLHDLTRVTISDLTISAGGSLRSTSDAIDFDGGNDSVVERVKIIASRGRGIVFDGKDYSRSSDRNVIRDCVISGAASDGIEFLGASSNLVERCTITDVRGHGIQATKASASAGQPHKKSSDNVIRDNTIDNAGLDGINVNAGDRNRIEGNRITNSGNVGSGSGIRINSADSITCDDNFVGGNVATDNQATKTQRYGLHIANSLCNRTVVGVGNDFAGNLLAPINDRGTATQFVSGADTSRPTVPGNVTATAVGPTQINLSWLASTDNVGVDHYTIRRGGQVLTTVPGTATGYSDTSVQPATSYSYTVEAFDAAGNGSAESGPASATTPGTGGGSSTFTPEADSYVSESSPTTNYGPSTSMRVDGSPLIRSFLRFSVQGVAGTVSRATLRVYANSASNTGHSATTVADNSWTETGLVFSNAPALGAVVGSSGPVAAGTWTSIDVTAYITGNGTYSLALTTPSSTAISYASRESANRPQLVVEAT